MRRYMSTQLASREAITWTGFCLHCTVYMLVDTKAHSHDGNVGVESENGPLFLICFSHFINSGDGNLLDAGIQSLFCVWWLPLWMLFHTVMKEISGKAACMHQWNLESLKYLYYHKYYSQICLVIFLHILVYSCLSKSWVPISHLLHFVNLIADYCVTSFKP